MRRLPRHLLLLLTLCVTPVVTAQTTRPASDVSRPPSDASRPASDASRPAPDATRSTVGGSLAFRANQAFNTGDYTTALPLLQRLAVQLRNDPDRVGPILEKVRVAEANVNQMKGIGPDGSVNATRKPHRAPGEGQTVELDVRELGNFDYDAEKGGAVPDDVKKLSGTKFKTTGYMIPLDQASDVTQFALVNNLFACCFGQPPQIQHTLIVYTPKGKAVSYYPDEIVVEGTLNVEEKKDEGYTISLFELTATSIKPAAK